MVRQLVYLITALDHQRAGGPVATVQWHIWSWYNIIIISFFSVQSFENLHISLTVNHRNVSLDHGRHLGELRCHLSLQIKSNLRLMVVHLNWLISSVVMVSSESQVFIRAKRQYPDRRKRLIDGAFIDWNWFCAVALTWFGFIYEARFTHQGCSSKCLTC